METKIKRLIYLLKIDHENFKKQLIEKNLNESRKAELLGSIKILDRDIKLLEEVLNNDQTHEVPQNQIQFNL